MGVAKHPRMNALNLAGNGLGADKGAAMLFAMAGEPGGARLTEQRLRMLDELKHEDVATKILQQEEAREAFEEQEKRRKREERLKKVNTSRPCLSFTLLLVLVAITTLSSLPRLCVCVCVCVSGAGGGRAGGAGADGGDGRQELALGAAGAPRRLGGRGRRGGGRRQPLLRPLLCPLQSQVRVLSPCNIAVVVLTALVAISWRPSTNDGKSTAGKSATSASGTMRTGRRRRRVCRLSELVLADNQLGWLSGHGLARYLTANRYATHARTVDSVTGPRSRPHAVVSSRVSCRVCQ